MQTSAALRGDGRVDSSGVNTSCPGDTVLDCHLRAGPLWDLTPRQHHKADRLPRQSGGETCSVRWFDVFRTFCASDAPRPTPRPGCGVVGGSGFLILGGAQSTLLSRVHRWDGCKQPGMLLLALKVHIHCLLG